MRIKMLEAYEVPELYKILSKPAIAKHLAANPTVITENTLGSFLLTTDAGTSSVAYSVYEKEQLMGVITLNNICHIKNSGYIGVLAMDDCPQGVGSGVRAAKWLLTHCFENLNLNRVYSHTWSDNERMDSFYERIGGVYEGTERQHTWKNGKYVDMKIWSMLRSEWIEQKGD